MKKLSAFFTFRFSPFARRGFTLLEIMIALAIIGGLLITLLYSLNYHLGIAERQETLTIATMLAKNKLHEIETSPAATKGDFPDPYGAYHYTTEIKASPYPGISEILVTVVNGKENVKFSEFIEKTL
ncbi:MAG: type II secretion system protein [Nitrospiraceae bacterium]|nr:type II secretion system protein [Nitrospiraceae bacterium]